MKLPLPAPVPPNGLALVSRMRIVVHQVQAQRPTARPGVGRHRVLASAAAHARDRRASHRSRGHQGKVRGVHARHALAEQHRPRHARRVRRRRAHSIDRLHRRRCRVDGTEGDAIVRARRRKAGVARRIRRRPGRDAHHHVCRSPSSPIPPRCRSGRCRSPSP